MGISFMARDTYSVYDYFKMAGIVKEYMDENGRAPDSIEYEGAEDCIDGITRAFNNLKRFVEEVENG